MPVNSSALRRFQIYDYCLSDTSRQYTREDIIRKLRNEENRQRKESGDPNKSIGLLVNDRQFFKDLKTIEEEWDIKIDRLKNRNNKKVYRYKNPNFSIFSSPSKKNYLLELRDTLFILKQFRGLPHFQFIDDLLNRIDDEDGTIEEQKIIVDFDSNNDFAGLEHFTPLLNAIQRKTTLAIKYNEKFIRETNVILYPYFLKEYTNRWFLFGTTKGNTSITNIALDRIIEVDYQEDEPYIETDIDFESDYFADVIGVTIKKEREPVEVVLKFSEGRFPYVESKPMHGSQKTDKENRLVKLKVIPNQELEALILHYGSDVEVLEPESLREAIKKKITHMYKIYFDEH
ncbi:MAG TPA: WYL domain-containing protein [Tenuifilaceae bacterium]|nr:WYL domain-containing protein [Tenuifilaceae bacterium]